MIAFVIFLIVITGLNLSNAVECDQEERCVCEGSDMDAKTRKDFLDTHNRYRSKLANGQPFYRNSDEQFPNPAEIPDLKYDCDLENIARKRAKECSDVGLGEHFFGYVGSNNATLEDEELPSGFVQETVEKWWRTGLNGDALVDLTPQEKDREKIPFLQIANAQTTKLGCAYHKCDSDGYHIVTCQYGDSNVGIGSPIYVKASACH